jgi:hypothetical protein
VTAPTNEELLRLARKAFAKLWAEREQMVRDEKVDPTDIAHAQRLAENDAPASGDVP